MIDDSLKENHEFMLEAMQIDIEILSYAGKLIKDVEFMSAAISIDEEAANYTDESIKESLAQLNLKSSCPKTPTPMS
jgi:hypothetical protein